GGGAGAWSSGGGGWAGRWGYQASGDRLRPRGGALDPAVRPRRHAGHVYRPENFRFPQRGRTAASAAASVGVGAVVLKKRLVLNAPCGCLLGTLLGEKS